MLRHSQRSVRALAHRHLSRTIAYRSRARNNKTSKLSEEDVRKLVDPKGYVKLGMFAIFAGSFLYWWNYYLLPWIHKDDKDKKVDKPKDSIESQEKASPSPLSPASPRQEKTSSSSSSSPLSWFPSASYPPVPSSSSTSSTDSSLSPSKRNEQTKQEEKNEIQKEQEEESNKITQNEKEHQQHQTLSYTLGSHKQQQQQQQQQQQHPQDKLPVGVSKELIEMKQPEIPSPSSSPPSRLNLKPEQIYDQQDLPKDLQSEEKPQFPGYARLLPPSSDEVNVRPLPPSDTLKAKLIPPSVPPSFPPLLPINGSSSNGNNGNHNNNNNNNRSSNSTDTHKNDNRTSSSSNNDTQPLALPPSPLIAPSFPVSDSLPSLSVINPAKPKSDSLLSSPILVQNSTRRQTEKLNPRREFTRGELKQYDGHDPASPIYVAVCGVVYDVTEGGAYEPSFGYSSMAGEDASWLLATMSLDTPEKTSRMTGPDPRLNALTPSQQQTLREWQGFFSKKYPVAGILL